MTARDWSKIVGNTGSTQYKDRIDGLKERKLHTKSIEDTVEETVDNLKTKESRSFVIFGEPQSGKTEMMIALNARLLDEGYPVIINLLTDSVDLLDQSLQRFRASGLNPSPKQFSELPDDPKRLRGQEWVVFSKKNARDLEKLNQFLRHERELIVIDDEADYASPDGNVNKPDYDKTKINKLISDLIGENGKYIGVTATPARLNLNNTFDNDGEYWVDFQPHPFYVGQDFFFPQDGKVDYRLHTFSAEEGNERAEILNAILHFLCGVAELHQAGRTENYTMLIHTSGKKDEHAEDVDLVQSTLSKLSNAANTGFESLRKKLWKVAEEYSDEPDAIGEFVLRHIRQNTLVEINSRNTKSGKVSEISKPTSLFSFGVGGNIISRGVTFDNLLSLYFARSVKGKFSQDTYIQRARMFGSREEYKEYFQLWIPEALMGNWSKCFAFHKLALDALRSSAGAPVWLSDHKTTPTAARSIDKSSVDFEGGEMSFALFDCDLQEMRSLFDRSEGESDKERLQKIRARFSEEEFPDYVYSYLIQQIRPDQSVVSFHQPREFGGASKKYSAEDVDSVRRDPAP